MPSSCFSFYVIADSTRGLRVVQSHSIIPDWNQHCNVALRLSGWLRALTVRWNKILPDFPYFSLSPFFCLEQTLTLHCTAKLLLRCVVICRVLGTGCRYCNCLTNRCIALASYVDNLLSCISWTSIRSCLCCVMNERVSFFLSGVAFVIKGVYFQDDGVDRHKNL